MTLAVPRNRRRAAEGHLGSTGLVRSKSEWEMLAGAFVVVSMGRDWRSRVNSLQTGGFEELQRAVRQRDCP